eukprot:271804-Ditylum_brightwellii.AAC.1
MEEYMGKAQRRVTPIKSASTITSLEEKGRGQAEKDHSFRLLRITHHSATGEQSKETWENKKHTDAEMEPVEETKLDLLMLEGKHTKAPGKDETTFHSETNR